MTQAIGRIAVYPGTFDPITNGHRDIIQRAARLVDRLVVAVASNDGKGPLFTTAQRLAMVEEEIRPWRREGLEIEVMAFDCLLMHFVQKIQAKVIIRGLRAVSDFEYEFQMAGMNSRLDPTIETVFLMAAERQHFISSRFVKEIGRLGGAIDGFVSPHVASALKAKFHPPPPSNASSV
jgi:pantetheine-phosphate adenylyltransferase